MAKLLPSSNSAIVKYQKSAVSNTIRPNKLLNIRSKTTAVKGEVAKEPPRLLGSSLSDIEKKIIQVDKLLKDSLLLSKKEDETKRKSKEKEKFEGKEKELEKKKPLITKGVKLPSPPKIGFLGWIKNFITQTILGFFAVRLIDFLPQLLKILPVIIKVGDFFIDVGGKMLDGLITFVDWGYKAIDGTRQFIKQLGGEGLAQNFDKFAGAIDNVIEIAIIAALATADSGGFNDKGPDVSPKKPTGKPPRGPISQLGRKAFVGTLGKGGAKTVLKFIRPFTKRLPIIGGLLDFGLSVALGEKIGRAAFRAIGATLLGAVGAAVGGPFALLTGLAGGTLGDIAGGALYDLFFENKKPKGKTVKAAGGGKPATRGGKPVSGPAKRTVKKKKTPRTLRATPSKLKPGGVVGGEKKIKQLYPEAKDKSKMSPFDFLKNSYNTFAKSSGLGALVALAIKPIMGDKPTYADYKNAGTGINNWMNQSIGSGTFAYAGGGEVKMESIVSGEDYSDVIAKSLQDSVAPEIDKTIRDLMRQLMLKQPTKEPDKTDPTKPTDDELPPGGLTTGQWGPLLDLIAGKESGGNYESMYPSTTLPGATKMTIAEVARRATGAVGKYQQLPQYLVGRAKAAGLNPDKDLYSPENQEKIIINVNIKGRGGEKWLKGEISDEQFMQGLSQEFASLPNAQGKFYYPGQRSAMTPEKVKAALSKVKKGGYTQQELATAQPGSLDKGKLGGSLSEYITGDPNTPFGKFDKAGHGLQSNYHDHLGFKDRATAERAYNFFRSKGIQVTEFKGYGPVGGHATGSLHYSGLAFDVPGAQWGGSGAIGSKDYQGSAKVRATLKQFLGGGGTQIASKFHGGTGFVSKDGMTLKLHKGEMYKVVDKDSVDLFGKDLIQDIIDIENKSQLVAKAPSIIEKLKAISGYTDYEQPYSEPQITFIPVPTPDSGGMPAGTSKPSLSMDYSTIDTYMSSQMGDELMYG